ncbi:aminodeoxychorismate lyase [Candidatus Nitrotoga sp. M5]|uniref:aminodeoxychorismate lyase n=1 Tax=Candidatus Nitrotoga sp. M5 TaxID=2890409 RepID=UPI001EF369F5|nr:aminodeoxychorismate lyase [Candidatus Nitrotoga sp. M5]CAH1385902.1 Aminodeoxychorismate lyase [Candidatus Nitrotoga sp. M5]
MLINGVPRDHISIHDRGLIYGDGVFRTLRVLGGYIQCWSRHYHKLQQDCIALQITCPEAALLSEELQRLIEQRPSDGVAKIIITRGEQSARGYAPAENMISTRILTFAPPFDCPDRNYSHGIKLRVCELRLAHQPKLAGIKHLNRLENVLAAAECCDPDIAEGLLLDNFDNVIEGIRSNLFMVRDGELFTPNLSNCGVAGIQRERVIEWAARHGVPCWVSQFGLAELLVADEIFMVNSVIGLWPVRELSGIDWNHHPIAMQVQEWLSHAHD